MGLGQLLVVMLSLVAVGLVLYPFQQQREDVKVSGKPSYSGVGVVLISLLHLLSFATSFGSSLWVSFIGGIIMFKNLPRHQFGNLQAQMFPVYFKLVAACGAICVISVTILHPWSVATGFERLQVVVLGGSLGATLLNLFYFQPLTIKVMTQRHKVERQENIGSEVGMSRNSEVAKRNPELAKLNKRFGMIHGFSSLCNLFSFACLSFHSWYLASQMLP
ncbi:unnamed protein product [Sphagnum jensenii]|uniref:TMEM205-like domain-containing protein n=1 Tax=Sphagnum jensenii TaxID=128206 RepID=A0ABP1AWX6_9BRYO